MDIPERLTIGHQARDFLPCAVLGAFVLVGVCGSARGGDAAPKSGAAIEHILPHKKVGQEVCFAGTFSDQKIDMEDWSHTVSEQVPGVFVAGMQAFWPVPRALPGQDITRIALLLTYLRKTADDTWSYSFTLMAESKSLGKTLFARSGCDWYEGADSSKVTVLYCWIECDGGAFNVEGISSTTDLNVRFRSLFMQPGCDGGGPYRVGTGDSDNMVDFRIEKAPIGVCKPLKVWARKN